MRAGRLARWSPLLIAVGVPALTLTVELVQAALTPSDHDGAASAPRGTDAAGLEELSGADPAPTVVEEMPTACRALLDLVAAELGVATVAWAHSCVYWPRAPRRRERLRRLLHGGGR
jgi:hypothetical protein